MSRKNSIAHTAVTAAGAAAAAAGAANPKVTFGAAATSCCAGGAVVPGLGAVQAAQTSPVFSAKHTEQCQDDAAFAQMPARFSHENGGSCRGASSPPAIAKGTRSKKIKLRSFPF